MKHTPLEKLQANRSKIVFFTKCFLLLYTMLIAVAPLNSALYFSRKLVCAWNLLLCAWLVLSDFGHYRRREYLVLALFVLSYAGTVFLNCRNHLLNELMILAYTVSAFFVMTYQGPEQTAERAERELCTMGWCVTVLSLLLSSMNLVIYVLAFPDPVGFSARTGLYGIGNSQLGGLYNPNTGCVINYISMLTSVFLLRKTGTGGKVLLLCNVLIQMLCFSLAQSRGGWVCLLTAVIVYFLFAWRPRNLQGIRRAAASLGLAVLCIAVLTAGSKWIRQSIVYTVARISFSECQEDKTDEEQAEWEQAQIQTAVNRKDLNSGHKENVTSGRTMLWRVGLEAWKEHPVLGIGYRNIDGVFRENLTPGWYALSAAGGLHNVYITALVAAGALGFLLFAVFLLILLLSWIKILRSPSMPDAARTLAAFLPALLVGELVESRILLQLNYVAVLFWLSAGYLLYYGGRCEKNG